jgi:xylulose-5-phosphate/fructose-6-phosphate phosphoketolase
MPQAVSEGSAKLPAPSQPLSAAELRSIDAYWRAANYLSVGQIYLYDNPLLRTPSPRSTSSRGCSATGARPGTELHLRPPEPGHPQVRPQRALRHGPGPRRPRPRRERLPRGHLQRGLPERPAGRGGDARLFKQFSFPGGIPSHVAPETPGSIHEGGELGYALSHAYGAAFDNPNCWSRPSSATARPRRARSRLVALEQVPDPATDGAVLPILHLNGYKIANPRSWPASATRSSTSSYAATATPRTSSKGTIPS